MDHAQTQQEFAAIQVLYKELEPLDPHARRRVVKYLVDLLKIEAGTNTTTKVNAAAVGQPSHFEVNTDSNPFGTFADLFDATSPDSNSDKALVAGYWLQEQEKQESFDSQSINTLLKNLGHGVPNITAALSALKDQKPALALQLKKSGSSQQARKTYKITVAGLKAVQEMMKGSDA